MTTANSLQPAGDMGRRVRGFALGLLVAFVLAWMIPKLAVWYDEKVTEGGRSGMTMLWIASFPGQHRLSTWSRERWQMHNVVIAICLPLAPLAGAFLARKVGRGSWLGTALPFGLCYVTIAFLGARIASSFFSPFSEEAAGVLVVAATMSAVGAALSRGRPSSAA